MGVTSRHAVAALCLLGLAAGCGPSALEQMPTAAQCTKAWNSEGNSRAQRALARLARRVHVAPGASTIDFDTYSWCQVNVVSGGRVVSFTIGLKAGADPSAPRRWRRGHGTARDIGHGRPGRVEPDGTIVLTGY